MKIRIVGSFGKSLPKLLNGIHWVTFCGGICLCSMPLLVYVESTYAQWAGNRELAEAAEPSKETIVAKIPVTSGTRPSQPRGSVLGKFEVPRLGLSYILLEGTDHKTLDKSIGHIEGTAMIGDSGNIGIAGHRNTHFRKLEWIRLGDEILLSSKTTKLRYAVEWVRLFQPEDTEVLNPEHGPAITLVTCFPFEYVGAAPLRLIIRALPLESATAEKSDTTGTK